MAKLYAITHGEYSDYRIITLCSDREKAEKLVEWYNRYDKYDPADIEEYEDSIVVPDESLIPYKVVFNADGSVYCETSCWPMDAIVNHSYMCKDGRFGVYVLATDEASAVKIAAEKRAVYLAQQNGI